MVLFPLAGFEVEVQVEDGTDRRQSCVRFCLSLPVTTRSHEWKGKVAG